MNNWQDLKDAVDGYEEINYRQIMVERNEESYRITIEFITEEVSRLVEKYRNLTALGQRARLTRDGIDKYLRRGHEYLIEGRIGAHYREVGVDLKDCVFEHVIPQRCIRDLLIQDRISLAQAMNPPTCYISKAHDTQLSEKGLFSKTPDIWHFFDRYSKSFDARFETFNGQAIADPHNWNLGQHYEFFGVTQ